MLNEGSTTVRFTSGRIRCLVYPVGIMVTEDKRPSKKPVIAFGAEFGECESCISSRRLFDVSIFWCTVASSHDSVLWIGAIHTTACPSFAGPTDRHFADKFDRDSNFHLMPPRSVVNIQGMTHVDVYNIVNPRCMAYSKFKFYRG